MNSNCIHTNPIEFSVVIPLYNKEKSICSTIESVLNQTHSYFELIIVNDGSTDNSLKVAKSFKDPRINIISKLNGGVSSARNKGIEMSQKEFIIFLDADDLWLPFCLEEFCKLIMEFPEAEVYCTNYNMTGKDLRGSDRRYFVSDYFYTSAFYLAKWSIPIMITGCVSIRRTLFNEIGYFKQNITHGEDVEMWERLAEKYKIAKSEVVTTEYRTETENRASLVDERLKLKADQIDFKRNRAQCKSQKLYYGVQSVFELKSVFFTKKSTSYLRSQINFIDWMFRGIVFIIKVRFLKISISPNLPKSK
jgi:glycosyltransferase involved in cell wall biosynthesis